MKNAYDFSIDMAIEVGASVKECGFRDISSSVSKIRREMNSFLLCMNHSNYSEGRAEQIHFLFIAIGHLDNMDREIRISASSDELIRLERIHDKIRILKIIILKYIKHLMSEGQVLC